MRRANTSIKVILSSLVLTCFLSFILVDLLKVKHVDATLDNLPAPTQLLESSKMYEMPLLKGIKLDKDNPLKIDFIVDHAYQDKISHQSSSKLVNYFLAALTVPQEDFWVNLSPYEKDRVIEDRLGITDLGRDMLGQDYVLKQIMSSMTYPEKGVGKEYWLKLNKEMPNGLKANVDTFNKVWITPGNVEVLEYKTSAIITDAELKVQLEEDYLAKTMSNMSKTNLDSKSNDLLKEIIIPEIEDEVNYGKHFAPLRQLYHSLILALWFKQKFSDSFYKHYINNTKVSGIDIEDKKAKEKIFARYKEAFEKGVYDYIKKEKSPTSNEKVSRRYFSGGVSFNKNIRSSIEQVDKNEILTGLEDISSSSLVSVVLNSFDRALKSKINKVVVTSAILLALTGAVNQVQAETGIASFFSEDPLGYLHGNDLNLGSYATESNGLASDYFKDKVLKNLKHDQGDLLSRVKIIDLNKKSDGTLTGVIYSQIDLDKVLAFEYKHATKYLILNDVSHDYLLSGGVGLVWHQNGKEYQVSKTREGIQSFQEQEIFTVENEKEVTAISDDLVDEAVSENNDFLDLSGTAIEEYAQLEKTIDKLNYTQKNKDKFLNLIREKEEHLPLAHEMVSQSLSKVGQLIDEGKIEEAKVEYEILQDYLNKAEEIFELYVMLEDAGEYNSEMDVVGKNIESIVRSEMFYLGQFDDISEGSATEREDDEDIVSSALGNKISKVLLSTMAVASLLSPTFAQQSNADLMKKDISVLQESGKSISVEKLNLEDVRTSSLAENNASFSQSDYKKSFDDIAADDIYWMIDGAGYIKGLMSESFTIDKARKTHEFSKAQAPLIDSVSKYLESKGYPALNGFKVFFVDGLGNDDTTMAFAQYFAEENAIAMSPYVISESEPGNRVLDVAVKVIHEFVHGLVDAPALVEEAITYKAARGIAIDRYGAESNAAKGQEDIYKAFEHLVDNSGMLLREFGYPVTNPKEEFWSLNYQKVKPLGSGFVEINVYDMNGDLSGKDFIIDVNTGDVNLKENLVRKTNGSTGSSALSAKMMKSTLITATAVLTLGLLGSQTGLAEFFNKQLNSVAANYQETSLANNLYERLAADKLLPIENLSVGSVKKSIQNSKNYQDQFNALDSMAQDLGLQASTNKIIAMEGYDPNGALIYSDLEITILSADYFKDGADYREALTLYAHEVKHEQDFSANPQMPVLESEANAFAMGYKANVKVYGAEHMYTRVSKLQANAFNMINHNSEQIMAHINTKLSSEFDYSDMQYNGTFNLDGDDMTVMTTILSSIDSGEMLAVLKLNTITGEISISNDYVDTINKRIFNGEAGRDVLNDYFFKLADQNSNEEFDFDSVGDKLGGIDMAEIDISITGQGLPMAFMEDPFDMSAFAGFVFKIVSQKQVSSEEELLAFLP